MLRDSLPDTFSAHMHCVKREMYKLTDISDHEMYMYGTKFVFISAGINDLSRYDHRNYSLAADFKAKIDILCRKYPDTTFIFNALLLTKFGWLNREINLFNRHIFDHSLRRNNLWFFDSHHICCKLGEGGHPIHIATLPKSYTHSYTAQEGDNSLPEGLCWRTQYTQWNDSQTMASQAAVCFPSE